MSSDDDEFHTPNTFSSSDEEDNSNRNLLKKSDKKQNSIWGYYFSSCYGYKSLENMFSNLGSTIYSTGLIKNNNDEKVLEIWESKLKDLNEEKNKIKIKAINIKNNKLEKRCESELKKMMEQDMILSSDIELCESMIEIYKKKIENENGIKNEEYNKILKDGKSKVRYVIENESLKDMKNEIDTEQELKLLLEQRHINKQSYDSSLPVINENELSQWYENVTNTKSKGKKKTGSFKKPLNQEKHKENQQREKKNLETDEKEIAENISTKKKMAALSQ